MNDAPTRPPSRSANPNADTRLAAIEVLRAIAAIAVVFHHSWSLSTMPHFPGYWIVEGFGTWGVTLFFVLSGYLLADHFWRGETTGRLKRFYTRRIFRVAPAYYVNVAILFVFLAVHNLLFSAAGARQVVANATFTQYLFPSTSSSLNVNGALWTLTVEAVLYLVMPVLAWFVQATRGVGVFVLAAIGLAYRAYVALDGGGLQNVYFPEGFPDATARIFLIRQFLGVLPLFAIGIGLKWLVFNDRLRLPLRVTSVTTVTPLLVLLLLPSVASLVFIERAYDFHRWVWFTGYEFTLGLLLVPAVAVAGALRVRSVSATDRFGVWAGERSYGLYLWHFPIILSVYGIGASENPPQTNYWVLRMSLILVLAFVAAALSWRCIEKPAQELARRRTVRPVAPVDVVPFGAADGDGAGCERLPLADSHISVESRDRLRHGSSR